MAAGATNVVRLLAYSSIAQAGYIMVPFAVAGQNERALQRSTLPGVDERAQTGRSPARPASALRGDPWR